MYAENDGLSLFDIPEGALHTQESHNPIARVKSHYMTIIEVDRLAGEIILKVVSWGKFYYVNYKEYAKKINLFTNILKVE